MDDIIQNNPKMTDFLKVFEECCGFQLPSGYRKFIEETNGGIPQKKYFTFGKSDEGSLLNIIFGITANEYASLIKHYREYRHVLPPDMIPIADDQGGNIIALCINGQNYGNLYFLDHDNPLIHIADSFEEFINSLKSEDEID